MKRIIYVSLDGVTYQFSEADVEAFASASTWSEREAVLGRVPRFWKDDRLVAGGRS